MDSIVPTRRQIVLGSIPMLLGLGGAAAMAGDGGKPGTDGSKPGVVGGIFAQASTADGQYALPKLPYAYAALEPHIDAMTMEIHHSRHHKAYVDNANRALKLLSEIQGADADPRVVESLQRDIAFNVGGHVLHTLFWATMSPKTDATPNVGGAPVGKIAGLIDSTFKSYDNFKAYFSKVAMSVKGSGWAILVHCPMTDRLMTFSLGDQDTRHAAGTRILLGVDVWEHAYYLKYQNKRADYVAAWFNTIHWDAVNELLG
jgi:superoxide dismutase, Fe-Mn family